MSGAGAAVQRHMDEEDGPLVTDLWRRTLRRRSQKDRLTWDQMTKLVDDWLPKPSYQPSTNPPGSPLVRQLRELVQPANLTWMLDGAGHLWGRCPRHPDR